MSENAAEFSPVNDDVFSRIAKDYDRYCDYFNFFIQRLWKRTFAAEIVACQDDWLDLASGTGDIPARVLHQIGRSGRMVVSDICPPMMDIARRKLTGQSVDYALIDACDMRDVPDNSFNVITMAFGMKIIDRQRALPEILRCLKPGGVFMCIEASRIGWQPLQALYLAYMKTCLPLMGLLIARGNRSAYDYLLRGIDAFPSAAKFAEELRQYGFSDISFRRLTLGIVAIHRAYKRHIKPDQ